MATTTVTFRVKPKRLKKMLVEIDRQSFERLVDTLGFFGRDFLESLDRADRDIKKGRVKKLRSLKSLRK